MAVLAFGLGRATGADAYVYWANSGSNAIGRALNDGTSPNQSFITGAVGVSAIAVDATRVYWANGGMNTIGRSNLDGTGVDQAFITGVSSPCGLAVDNAHL